MAIVVVLAGVGFACGDDSGGGGDPMPMTCGNSVAEGTEQCDGTDLRGANCATLGMTGGPLGCNTAVCMYNTASCIPAAPTPMGGTTGG